VLRGISQLGGVGDGRPDGCRVERVSGPAGQQARMSDLVEIFDAGPDMDLVSVTEQQEFTLTWYRALGIPD
jgi:hypothetical protein